MSVIKGRLMTRDPHMVGLADDNRERVRGSLRCARTPRGRSKDQVTTIEFEMGEVPKTCARKEGSHARRTSTGRPGG